MAHKNPIQLSRLIDRLQHPNFDIYIHLDKKIELDAFEFLEKTPRVWFIKDRVKCNWGGWNFTKGIVKSMKEVMANESYGFINLISAQDYPIYSADQIYNYLIDNKGQNFIYFADKESQWIKEAAYRYQRYHFTDFEFKGKYFFQKILNKIIPKRILPENMKIYGGSNSSWWTISGDCASYVVNKISGNVAFDNFFKYSWGSDEFVITTVIMNSEYREKSINNNFRYIDWSAGGAHPKFLVSDDLPQIINSQMLFARKFDINIDEEILDKIDVLELKYNAT